jgi:peptidoglycan/xylan/chitin deacetylase (PgdA/CDA1 family)
MTCELHDKTVAILAYHKVGDPRPGGWKSWFFVPEGTFLAHLNLLQDMGWAALCLPEFLRGLSNPENLPEKAVLISFDDGYQSVREVAMPLLRRFGYPSVLFVPTDFIGGYNTFDDGVEPQERLCDWNDLRELARAGVSIQSHGVSHKKFSELTLTEIEQELLRSKALLEKNVGGSVEIMAFPYGDHGANWHDTEQVLEKVGYQAACLYGGGLVIFPGAARYRLPRLAMGGDTDLARELGQLQGPD